MPIDLQNASFETERLVVRSCRIQDAPALQALMTPTISKWVATWPTPLTIAKTTEILRDCLQSANAGQSFAAVVEQKSTATPIGWLKLDISVTDQSRADLGYWIGEDHQRRGYALEMSQGAMTFVFDRLRLHRIRAGAQVANTASIAVLQKLGMTEEFVQDVWAPARQRSEACTFWEMENPS